jgi:hypothetical protein
MEKNNGELVKSEASEYAILKCGVDKALEIVRDNLGNQGISIFQLDRLKMPVAGGLSFALPTLEGDDAPVATVRGVIIAHKQVRSYWMKSFGSGPSGPPDCISEDCVAGIGNPGGDCGKCPLSKFGTAREGQGRGQACQQRMLMFVMRKDNILPLFVNFPPTSMAAAQKFMVRLASSQVHFAGVEVEIGLHKDRNADGIDFSCATFKVVRRLDANEAQSFSAIRKGLEPVLGGIPRERENLAVENN